MTSRKGSILRSLSLKIALLTVASILLVAAVVATIYSRGVERAVLDELRSAARAETMLFRSIVVGAARFSRPDHAGLLMDEFFVSASDDLEAVTILDAGGQVLAREARALDAGAGVDDLARAALQAGEPAFSADGLTIAYPILHGPEESVVGAVATRWSTAKAMAGITSINNRALGVATGALVVTLLCALFAYNLVISRPVRALRQTVGRLRDGAYDDPVAQTRRSDELGEIASALDELRVSLANAAETRRAVEYQSTAFSNASAPIMLVDADTKIVEVNRALVDLLRRYAPELRQGARTNFDPDDLVGRNVDHFHGHGQGDQIKNRIRSLGKEALEIDIPVGLGRLMLRVQAIHGGDGTIMGYLLEYSDVSELWLKNAMIDTIEGNQMLAEFTPDGRVTRMNALMRDGLRVGEAAMGTRRLADLVSGFGDDARRPAAVVDAVLKGEPFAGVVQLACANGSKVFLEGSLSCVRDRKGEAIRLLLLGTDITAAREALQAAETEQKAVEAQRVQVVEELRVGLRKLSDGDLTAWIDTPFAGGYDALRQDFNATVQTLERALVEIAESASNIRNESGDISNTADALSRRTESTAATLEEAAAALDALTTSVRATAEGALRADTAVSAAKVNAEESGQVVVKTVAAMDQIAASSEKITSIIKVIDDIAFQTNLLALNAGVEAARAGDAGRGFAVVASEVRALAQRSSDAAREINGLIADSGAQVRTGVDLVGRTGDALHQISQSVAEISTLVSEIAGSAQKQSLNLEEINASVNQLDQTTQQVAARLEETTAASEALRNDAVGLVETISHFRLSRPAEPSARRGSPEPAQREGGTAAAPARAAAGGGRAAPVAEQWTDF
ncbi:methyl-accepting chemotaxis protein [Roseivivax isoporae]|uniref:Chemotaxis protein n=1 Tax=Roseivivax isoporae LMG 25204 TaxID=1449351 RepID=X7FD03_9RHOB|nr:methyl-accepting chemotaxis protein [Roseivivax isoporae]ETX30608.1 chemotaxis protein [Roseivivax isoporae LMG 25204]